MMAVRFILPLVLSVVIVSAFLLAGDPIQSSQQKHVGDELASVTESGWSATQWASVLGTISGAVAAGVVGVVGKISRRRHKRHKCES